MLNWPDKRAQDIAQITERLRSGDSLTAVFPPVGPFHVTYIADEAIARGDKVRLNSNGRFAVVADDTDAFAGWALNEAAAGKPVSVAIAPD